MLIVAILRNRKLNNKHRQVTRSKQFDVASLLEFSFVSGTDH